MSGIGYYIQVLSPLMCAVTSALWCYRAGTTRKRVIWGVSTIAFIAAAASRIFWI